MLVLSRKQEQSVLIGQDIKITVLDLNKEKIAQWNDKNLDNLPIFEPGLHEIVKNRRGKNLFFSTEISREIELLFKFTLAPAF